MTPERTWARWTAAETETAVRLRAAGMSCKKIARQMPGRSESSVASRLGVLKRRRLPARVPGRAGLLAALRAANGALVTWDAAMAAAGASTRGVMRMHVIRLRRAGWSIKTTYGVGLQLDPAGASASLLAPAVLP